MLRAPRNVMIVCDHWGYRAPALEASSGRLHRRDDIAAWMNLCPFRQPRNLSEPFHCPKQQRPRIEALD